MPTVVADRVKQYTTTSGTGSISFSGTIGGYKAFSDVLSSGDETFYCVLDGDNGEAGWEVGIGTFNGSELSRDTVLASSTGSKISLSGNVAIVFITYPAPKSLFTDGNNRVGIGTGSPSYTLDVFGHDAWIQASGVKVGASGIVVGDHGISPGINALSDARVLGTSTATYLLDINLGNSGVYLGNQTQVNITSGGKSIHIGEQAGSGTTAGFSNVAIGYQAGKSITTGKRNVAIGAEAYPYGDDNHDNVFIGFQSADSASVGNYSIGIGAYAGYSEQGSNVNVGYKAGNSLWTYPINTTAIGYQSLSRAHIVTPHGANTMQYSVAVGSEAGYESYGAYGSTYIGAMAGYQGPGIGSVCIGFQAGRGIGDIGIHDHLFIANNEPTANGTLIKGLFNTKEIAIGSTDINVSGVGTLQVYPKQSTSKGVVIVSAVSQSAALTEWQNSTSETLAAMTPSGILNLYGVVASGDISAVGHITTVGIDVGNSGIILSDNAPVPTTNTLYNVGGALYFNGFSLGGGVSSNDLNYVSGISVYSSGQAIINEVDIVAVSGIASYASGLSSHLNGLSDVSFGGANLTRTLIVGNAGPDVTPVTGTLATDCEDNLAIGYQTLDSMTGADGNIALGYQSLTGLTTGYKNIAIGYGTVNTGVVTGYDNVAMGTSAATALTTGVRNVAIGFNSLYGATEGISNIAIGENSHFYATDGDYNVSIGHNSLYGGASTTDNNYNIAIGYDSLKGIINGDRNIAVGYGAGFALSTDSHMLYVANNTEASNGTLIKGDMSNKYLAVGKADVTLSTDPATLQVYVNSATDKGVIVQGASAQSDDLISWQTSAGGIVAGMTPSGVLNTYGIVASGTGLRLHRVTPTVTTDTIYNIAGALYWNGVAMAGGFSLADLNYVSGIAVYSSGQPINSLADVKFGGTNLTRSLIIGNAGPGSTPVTGSLTGDCADNIVIGYQSLDSITEADGNISLGYQSLTGLTTGYKNVSIGYGAGSSANVTGYDNVIVGTSAATSLTTGTRNVALGFGALYSLTQGTSNIAIGENSHYYATDGDYNISLGFGSLYGGASTTDNNYNIAIGYNTLKDMINGDKNIAIGYSAGYALTTDSDMLYVANNTEANNGTLIKGDMANKYLGVGKTDVTLSTDPATFQVYVNAATDKGVVIQGAAAQSDDLTSWKTSAASIVAGMTPSGVLNTYGIVASGTGLRMHRVTPVVTADTLYNVGGALYFNGSALAGGVSVADLNYVSGVAVYASGATGGGGVTAGELAGVSGMVVYSSGQAIANESDIVAVSGIANYASGQAIANEADIATNSGRVTYASGQAIANESDIVAVSGISNYASGQAIANESDIVAVSGIANYASGMQLNGLADVSFGGTNLTHTLLINNTPGSAPTHGTLGSDNQYNVGIGYLSLAAITDAVQNVSIGYAGNRFCTTGDKNVAIGSSALEQNTTGSTNVAIGYRPQAYANDGSNNIGIGYEVLIGNSDGTSTTGNQGNVGIGYQAGHSITTGDYNVIAGYMAAKSITTGSDNIAIGRSAVQTITDGVGNIGIGTSAFGSGSQSGNNYNVAIGSSAGYALTTGDKNIMLGYTAGYAHTSGDSMLFIANGSEAGNGTLIKGDMANKYLAIGKADVTLSTDPATLQLYPNAATDKVLLVQGFALQSDDLTSWQTSAGTVVAGMTPSGVLNTAGLYSSGNVVVHANVGIGTASPSVELEVRGDIRATFGNIRCDDFEANAGSTSNPSYNFSNNGGDSDTGLYSPGANQIGVVVGAAEAIRIDSSANVGIGTTAPSYKLDVFGHDAWVQASGVIVGASGVVLADNTPATTTNTLYNVGGSLYFSGSALGGGVSSSDLAGVSGMVVYSSGQAIANESDIVATSGIANYASGQANTNKTNIATNVTNIATNVTNIATNVTNIATNVTNIATNTSRVSYASGQAIANESDIVAVSGISNYASGQAIENEGLIAYASGNTANIAFGSNAEGDILYHNGTSFTRLAKGTDNYILKMSGNVPNWEASSGGGSMSSFVISDGSTTQTIADGNTITFSATSNETTVAVSATDTVTIGLPNDVTIGSDLTVTDSLVVDTTTLVANAASYTNRVGIGTATPSYTLDVFGHDAWVQASGVNVGASGVITNGHIVPSTTNTVDLGTSSVEFRNAYFDGTVTSDAFAGPLTGDVTGNADTVTNGVYTSNNLSVMAATTSAQLAGVISDETGTGALVFGTSPTLVTPALGTPSALVATNATGTAASLTAGTATVATTVTITDNESTDESNAIIFTAGGDIDGGNLGLESDGTLTYNPSTGKITATGFIGALTGNADTVTNGVYTSNNLSVMAATTSAQLAGVISDETGSGALVFGTSPTLVTPALGTPSALVATNATGTAASLTAGTATEATNVTVTANNSTDETVYPVFVDGATGTQGAETDTGLTYNPSTGLLTTTAFAGDITGDVTGNVTGTAATVTGGTQASITTVANVTTVGALNAGSITSGFGAIDNGSSNITTTGTLDISGGTLTLAANQISGDKVEGGTIAATTITALTTAGITATANIDIGGYDLRAATVTADGLTSGRVVFAGTAGLLSDDSDLTFSGDTLTATKIKVSDGGTIGSASDADAITIATEGDVTFSKATKPALKANSDGSTVTFDLNEANVHTVTLGGNRTFAISNETAGQKFIIRILQDGTGSRLVSTWFSTIKWAGGSAPTLTTTAGKADVVGFIVTGTDTYDGFVVGQNI